MNQLTPTSKDPASLLRLTRIPTPLAAVMVVVCFSIAASASDVPMLTAEEERATFQLPPGYRMELVVGDPLIKEPVAIAFDGNGRLFVAEMRAFMQDLDGTGQREKSGRISMHWSSKGDGVFDRHSVFIDGLVLPRMILPLDGALLVAETDSNDLHLYRDTDGDGVADKKELWSAGGPRGGNLEHQPSGLVWALDNWIYASYNAYRLRWNGAGRPPLQEPTPPNGGQWGVAQDDHGKLWFTGGAERGPQNFQQPILYGGFNITGQTPHDFSEVWPLVGLADVEGGAMRFRAEDKTLNHFSSPCGSEIIRGDRLPADLRGDLLVCEPVGRLIRRAKVEVRDGVTHLRNPHERSEFIRSTDPNFRPVSVANAPDGTLYIVDMYRGVVQEAVAIKKGSYLRDVVEKHGLEKNIGRGRVWRLVHESTKPSAMPKMLDETPSQLVSHLAHPNGWWRDTAQKLLVLRSDASVVPELKTMAQTNENPVARLHALWTLEGLRALDAALVLKTLKDESAALRIGAIRASESIMPKETGTEAGELQKAILALAADADPNVVTQVMMTAHRLAWPGHRERIESLVSQHRSRGVQEIGRQLLHPPASYLTDARFSEADRKFLSLGEVGYKSLCFACHGNEGRGTPAEGLPGGATLAPPLAGSPIVLGTPDPAILVLLHGLTGPVDGKTYVTQMVPMATNSDHWIASVLSYIRNSFGNQAPFITAKDVTRVRAATQDRKTSPTREEVKAF
jgi:glucose/arabinose dehydrogenase/mono/diheme cytochrome c family protein